MKIYEYNYFKYIKKKNFLKNNLCSECCLFVIFLKLIFYWRVICKVELLV